MLRILGVRDVLIDSRGVWYILGSAPRLRSLLGREQGRGVEALERLLLTADPDGDYWTRRSYLENATHWDGWESVIQFAVHEMVGKQDVAKIVIPVPSATIPRVAWSAKKQRVLPAGPRPKVDLCDEPYVDAGSPSGPVLMRLDWGPMPPLFVSHSTLAESLTSIRKCGGLLFPSWAISWRVPPGYGDITFFADVRLVTDNLTGNRRVFVAGTDIWSPTVIELQRWARAREWELAGDLEWWSGERMPDEGGWGRRGLQDTLLNSPIGLDFFVGGMADWGNEDIARRTTTRGALYRRMRGIYDHYVVSRHGKDADPYAYDPRSLESELRSMTYPYPYGEVKVAGRVRLSDLPLVVFPRRMATRVNKLLDEQGFTGTRLMLPWDGNKASQMSEAEQAAFARAVTQEVLSWAANPCGSGNVGPSLVRRDSWQVSYDPLLLWTRGERRASWQQGSCGSWLIGVDVDMLSEDVRDFVLRARAYPHRYSLERLEPVRSLRVEDAEIAALYDRMTVASAALSLVDARVATLREWFRGPVQPGDVVLLLDQSRA